MNSFYNDTSSITYKYFSAFSCMIYTGLLAGEVLALKWDDLIEEEEFIFATPENGHCTISRLQKSITNLIKLSGIGTNYGCHSFRHLFCSRLAHNGAKIVEIAELAGQSDLRTTARYMHSTELRKRNAINTLI